MSSRSENPWTRVYSPLHSGILALPAIPWKFRPLLPSPYTPSTPLLPQPAKLLKTKEAILDLQAQSLILSNPSPLLSSPPNSPSTCFDKKIKEKDPTLDIQIGLVPYAIDLNHSTSSPLTIFGSFTFSSLPFFSSLNSLIPKSSSHPLPHASPHLLW